MSADFDQHLVLDALSSPIVWPNRPDKVEVIETHAALIFLADEAVLKVKRAVKLAYLDFSTLEARHQACQREIELNAPHAPDIYRGMVPIRRMSDGAICIGGDSGVIVEWGVSMRRFPQDMLLSEMARRGSLTTSLMKSLADRVRAYHCTATRETPASDSIPAIVQSVMAAIAASPVPAIQTKSAEISMLLAHAMSDCTATRTERVEAGCVRRCHGDLHLRNIVLWRGEPVPFDALEFDEGLATIDTLYDLAFLLMDVDRKGGRTHANTLLNRYLWRSGDPLDLVGLEALPLFMGLRAGIRAMVALDRAAVTTDHDDAHVAHATETLECAATYLRPIPPSLIAIGGLSGTGKTTLATALAPLIGPAPGALHLRTDLERKWLAGVGELDRLPPDAYSDRQTRATYDRVIQRAETTLTASHSVIVDGVFSAQAERTAIEAIAKRVDVPFRGLWLEVAPSLMKARVAKRTSDASDATAAVVDRQLANISRVPDWKHIDANGPPEEVLQRVRDALRPFEGRFA
jgi:uncharacterized protein